MAKKRQYDSDAEPGEVHQNQGSIAANSRVPDKCRMRTMLINVGVSD